MPSALEELGALRARRQDYALIVNASASRGFSAKQRQMQADHVEAGIDISRRHLKGFAFVAESSFQRGMLTAIFWLKKPEWPHAVFSSLLDARVWCRERLAAATARKWRGPLGSLWSWMRRLGSPCVGRKRSRGCRRWTLARRHGYLGAMLHTVARCALLAILSVLLCLGCAGEEDGLNRQDGGGETASDAPGEAGGGRTLASDGIAGNGGDASRGGRSAGGPSGAAGRGDAGTGDPPSGGSDGGGGALGTGTEGGAGVGAAGSPTMGGTASGGAATGGSGGSASGGTPGGSAGQGGGGELPEGAVLELDHTRMSLDSISLGATAVETFTLTNRGASTSGVPSISTDVPSDAPNPVTIAGCDNALPGGASCELTISITPLELGLFDAVIRIRAEPGIEAPHLSIYAVGTVIGFEISGPTALDLGDIPSGVPVEHTVTVTALIDLSDLEVFTNGEVSIDDAQSTCTQTLAAGDTCVVTVQFDSPEVGWKGGRVGIRAGGSLGQLAVVDMTANVTNAADLAVDPEAPEPFVAYVDETTAPMVFTVTNLGASTSGTITAVLVGEGLGPASFDIVDTDCTTLAPQASCTLSVVCSPQPSAASLTREAILSVTDGNSHVPVRLSAKVSYR